MIMLNTMTLGAEHKRIGCLREYDSAVDNFSTTTLEAMGFENGLIVDGDCLVEGALDMTQEFQVSLVAGRYV